MKIIKKIGDISLVVLSIFSVLLSIFYIIYHFNYKSDTIGVYYIGEQSPVDLISKKDELTDLEISEYENRVLFNVNYYSNKNDNGLVVNEMRLDYFTDYTMNVNSCRSTGIQLTFDYYYLVNLLLQGKTLEYMEEFKKIDSFDGYYYETYDRVSWSGGLGDTGVDLPLSRENAFICKIDNTPYLFQLDGTYEVEVDKTFFGIKYGTKTETREYNYFDLFFELLSATATNSNGAGEYYISFDLSKYFTNIKAYNPETKQFDKTPSVDIGKKYCMIKIMYSEDGMINAKQSLFNTIACDSSYGMADINYWQERFVYNLNENNLSLRYSKEYNGYFASLNIETKNMFNEIPRSKVNITINISDKYLIENNINIIGFDYNAFENLEIDTIKILGVGKFYLLDGCLNNTNLKTLKHSNSIELVYGNNVIDTKYEVVVL